ncbi:hypothetical protein U1Q18_039738 [Sarracenia purpurea var. burkii]
MIFAALEALREKEGSNKLAISKYIESMYRELPAGHSSMLSHQLNRMKPPKNIPQPDEAKEGEEADEVLASPRPRGRPRMDPNALPPALKKAVSSSSSSGELLPKISEAAGISGGSKSGRPRGRPPKVKPQQAQDDDLNRIIQIIVLVDSDSTK